MKYNTIEESKRAINEDWRNVLNCDCNNANVVSYAIDCSINVLRVLPVNDVVYNVLRIKNVRCVSCS